MKFTSITAAIAMGLFIAGCGGGGGSVSGGSTNNGSQSSGGPSTSDPVLQGTASFSGSRSDYTVVRADGGYTVTDRRNNAGARVIGAASIRFADMTINLGIADKAALLESAKLKSLIELYIAFLKRVPEANSLGTWIDQSRAGQTLTQAADSLYGEAVKNTALTGYSASMLNSEFVTAVYKGVFGRSGATAPTPANVEAWSAHIDKGGISRGALMLAMLESARSGTGDLASAAVTQLLDNKVSVGDYFAVQQGINYNAAEESLTKTNAIASAVTSTDITAAKGLIGFADPSFNLRTTGK